MRKTEINTAEKENPVQTSAEEATVKQNTRKKATRLDSLNSSADILSKLCLKKCRELKKSSSDETDDLKSLKEASAVVKEVIAISKSLEDGTETRSCVRVVLEEPFEGMSQ